MLIVVPILTQMLLALILTLFLASHEKLAFRMLRVDVMYC